MTLIPIARTKMGMLYTKLFTTRNVTSDLSVTYFWIVLIRYSGNKVNTRVTVS